MRKFLLSTIAVFMSVAMMAIGKGDGTSKANAIDFDWANGHKPALSAGSWYRVSLSPLSEEAYDPTLALYLTNLTDETASVKLTMQAELLGKSVNQNSSYNIAGKDFQLWSRQRFDYDGRVMSLKQLMSAGLKEVYLQLTSNKEIALSAKVYETEDIVDDACTKAKDFYWSGVDVPKGEQWFRLNLSDVKSTDNKLKFVVTNNGSAEAKVSFDMSLDCPASAVIEKDWEIAPGADMEDEFGRVFLDVLKEDYVFLKLTNDQPLTLRVEEEIVVIPPGKYDDFDCASAPELAFDTELDLTAGQHIYKVKRDALLGGRSLASEFYVTNNGATPANLTVETAFSCPVKSTVDQSLVIEGNTTIVKAIKDNVLKSVDVEWVYLRFITDQDLTATVGKRNIDPCANAVPFDWTVGASLAAGESQWYEVDITSLKRDKKHLTLAFTNHSDNVALVNVEVALDCNGTIMPITLPIYGGLSIGHTIDYNLLKHSPLNRIYVGLSTDSHIEMAASVKDAIAADPTPCQNALNPEHGVEYTHEANTTHWYKISLDLLESTADYSSFYLSNKGNQRAHVTFGVVTDCQYTPSNRITLPMPTKFDLGLLGPNVLGKLLKELARIERLYSKVDSKDIYLEIQSDQPIGFGLDVINAATSPCLRSDLITFDWNKGAKVEKGDGMKWFDMDLDAVKAAGKHVKLTFTNHSDSLVWAATMVSVECPAKLTMPLLVPVPAGMSVDHVINYQLFAVADLHNIYIGVVTDGELELKAESIDATILPPANCLNAQVIVSGKEYVQNAGTQWYQFPMSLIDEMGSAAKISFKNLTSNHATLSAGVTVGCEYPVNTIAKAKAPRDIQFSLNIPKFIISKVRGLIDPALTDFYIQLTTDQKIAFTLNNQATDVRACSNAIDFDWKTWEQDGLQLEANKANWYKVNFEYVFEKLEKGEDISVGLTNPSKNMDVAVDLAVSPTCPVVLSLEKSVNIPAGTSAGVKVSYDQLMSLIDQYDTYDLYGRDYEGMLKKINAYVLYNKLDQMLTERGYDEYIPLYRIEPLVDRYGEAASLVNLKALLDNPRKYISVAEIKERLEPVKVKIQNEVEERMSFDYMIGLLETYGDKIPKVDAEQIINNADLLLPYIGSANIILDKCKQYISKEDLKQHLVDIVNRIPFDEVKEFFQRVENKLKQYMPEPNTFYIYVKTTGELVINPEIPVAPECEGIVDTIVAEACDTFVWKGIPYTESGIYRDSISASEPADAAFLDWKQTVKLSEFSEPWYKLDISEIKTNKLDFKLSLENDLNTTLNYTIELYDCYLEPMLSGSSDVEGGLLNRTVTYAEFMKYTDGLDCDYLYLRNVNYDCDRFEELHLTINKSVKVDTTVVACDSLEWNGSVYTVSGDYTDTLVAANGCDSIVTLHLTIENCTVPDCTVTGEETVVACDSYDWNGNTYTTSGDYVDTITLANGCDSIVTLHLTINQSVSRDEYVTVCYAAGETINGNDYGDTPGEYTEILKLTAANGCDSVITYHITVLDEIPETYITEEICEGGSFELGGVIFTQAVVDEPVVLQSVDGCDSIVNVTIIVKDCKCENAVDSVFNVVICKGEEYTWRGHTYTGETHVTVAGTDANGCSIDYTLNLIVAGETHYVTACDSYTYTIDGQTFTQTATGTYTHQLAGGCEYVLNLTINHSEVLPTEVVSSCGAYVWPVNGQVYYKSGEYQHNDTTSEGCTLTYTLNLTVTYVEDTVITAVICEGDEFEWRGNKYSVEGTYTETATINGCEATHTLHLVVAKGQTLTETACDSYTIVVDGKSYTYTESIKEPFELANGCNFILDLTINKSEKETYTVTACDSYEWHGTVYKASGEYIYNTTTAAGCNRVETLNLTINKSVVINDKVTTCKPYVWEVNGQTYNATDVYNYTDTTADGCDLTATLDLTIYCPEDSCANAQDSVFNVEICEGDTYYWEKNGKTYPTVLAPTTTDVPFVAGTDNGNSIDGEQMRYQISKDGITLDIDGRRQGNEYRIFSGRQLIITSANKNITKVEFTCTKSGTTTYGPAGFKADQGTYTYSGKVGIWIGSANEIVFTASPQVRATQIIVTYEGDAVMNTVGTDTISGFNDADCEINYILNWKVVDCSTPDDPCLTAEVVDWRGPIYIPETTGKWYKVDVAEAVASDKDIEMTVTNGPVDNDVTMKMSTECFDPAEASDANPYGWQNKNDMFQAFMADCGVTGLPTLDELKAQGAQGIVTIRTPFTNNCCQVFLDNPKWDWLEAYIMSVQNADPNAMQLTEGTTSAAWCYAIAAFFVEGQRTSWPRSADFSEAGKDEAYLPAWGHTYTGQTNDAGITVKAKVPADWTSDIYVWVWPTGGAGTEYPATKEGDFWTYTHDGDDVNIIFKNGQGWQGAKFQTVDMTFSEDACIQLTADVYGGKATYQVVDCGNSNTSVANKYTETSTSYYANEVRKTIITQDRLAELNINDYVYVYVETTGSMTITATTVEDTPCENDTVEYWETADCSYTWDVNGVTYDASGDYEYVTDKGDDCKTIFILHLTVNPCVSCETAELVDWRGPIYIPETTGKWYKVDVAEAVASDKDIEMTVTNGPVDNDVTMKMSTECFDPATTTVKAIVPADWTDQIYVWVWPTGGAGTEYPATKEGDFWTYTHDGDDVNIIFKNGQGWQGAKFQTVDMTFSEDACIQLTADVYGGKATYQVVDCGNSNTSVANKYTETSTSYYANEVRKTIITQDRLAELNINDYVYVYVETTGSMTITATTVEDTPCENDTVEYWETADCSYTWDVNGVTYDASGDYTHVTDKGDGCKLTEILHLTVNPCAPTPEIPGNPCLDAIPFDWTTGAYLAADSCAWYEMDITSLIDNKQHLTLTFTNHTDSTAWVYAVFALDCEGKMAPMLFPIPGGLSIDQTIDYQLLKRSPLRRIYVGVCTDSDIELASSVESAIAEDPAPCLNATNIEYDVKYVHNPGTSWYKVSTELLKNKSDLTGIYFANKGNKRAHVTVGMVADCQYTTGTTITLPIPTGFEFSVMAPNILGKLMRELASFEKAINELDVKEIYVEITTDETIEFELSTREVNDACETAIELDWKEWEARGLQLKANEEVWYAVNVNYLLEKFINEKEITLAVSNLDSVDVDVEMSLSPTCPVMVTLDKTFTVPASISAKKTLNSDDMLQWLAKYEKYVPYEQIKLIVEKYEGRYTVEELKEMIKNYEKYISVAQLKQELAKHKEYISYEEIVAELKKYGEYIPYDKAKTLLEKYEFFIKYYAGGAIALLEKCEPYITMDNFKKIVDYCSQYIPYEDLKQLFTIFKDYLTNDLHCYLRVKTTGDLYVGPKPLPTPCVDVVDSLTVEACESYEWKGYTYTQSGKYTESKPLADPAKAEFLDWTQPIKLSEFTESWYKLDVSDVIANKSDFSLLIENDYDSTLNVTLELYSDPTDWFMYSITKDVEPGTSPKTLTYAEFEQNIGTEYDVLYLRNVNYDCKLVEILNLTINNSVETEDYVKACDSYLWNGQTYTVSGDYTYTTTAANGCDSIVTLHLTIISCPPFDTIAGYVCDGTEYVDPNTGKKHIISSLVPATLTWDEVVTTADTIYYYHYVITPIVAPEVLDDAALALIPGATPVLTQGLVPDVTGTTEAIKAYYVDNDAEDIADVTAVYWDAASLTVQVACGAVTHTMNLVVETECDNVLTSTHTFEVPALGVGVEENVTLCAGETYVWNGKTYNATGTYEVTLTGATGCDSIATLNLTVLPAIAETVTEVTLCAGESYTWEVTGTTYNATTTESIVLKSVNGCDSVVTLNLTVLPAIAETVTEVTICAGESYTWDVTGTTYNATTTESIVLKSVNDCDSVVTLKLTVLPVIPETTDEATICAGETYTWSANGKTYNTTTTETITLTSVNGCDSVVTLNLTVLPEIPETTENVTICYGETYTWVETGKAYTTTTTESVILKSVNGCDSVVTLNLVVLPEIPVTEEVDTICAGETYTWSVNGKTYNATTTESVTLKSVNDCDSVVTLKLTVLPVIPETTDEATICAGETYTWSANGKTYNTTTTETITLTSVNGCDSVVTLNLTVLDPIAETVEYATVCAGETYTWSVNGKTYNATTTESVTLKSVNGCDSVVTLNLTVLPEAVTETEDLVVCESELPYVWRGEVLSAAGTYTVVEQYEEFACDSVIHVLNLQVYTLTLPASVADPIAVCGNPVDVTAANADIDAHIASNLYAPNATVTWYIMKNGTWTALTDELLKGSDESVTLKYIITTDCGSIESERFENIPVEMPTPINDVDMDNLPVESKYGHRVLLLNLNAILATHGWTPEPEEVKWYRVVNDLDVYGEPGDDEFTGVTGHYFNYVDASVMSGQYYALIVHNTVEHPDECELYMRTEVITCSTNGIAPRLLPNVARPNENMKLVDLNPEEITEIRVYSTTGELMDTYVADQVAEFIIKAAQVSGYYMVDVETQNNKVTLRYVVK